MRTSVAFVAAKVFLVLALGVTCSPVQRLRCLPGISKFSATGSPQEYFHCEAGAIAPSKASCSEGQVYNMRKQRCIKKGDFSDVLPLDEKALGRNFVLGAMYDARSNIAFPESSFWNQTQLEEHTVISKRLNVDLDVQSLYRTVDRTSYFDISAWLTVDFMGGSVHVAGSAGFLKEEVSSEEESNVAMVYSSTKYSKTIPKFTRKSYVDECTSDQYTHVVTSVDYGLDAIFSFKRLAKSHENKQSITGSLEISITKIPGATIEGSGSVNMTEWEQELFNTTTLEVFGDFSPESQLPTTYQEAVKFYNEVPAMAGEAADGYPGAQIVRVHLTPIIHMCSDAEVLYNELSDGMLAQVVTILDELQQLDIKVSSMMYSDLAVMFNPLRVNLNLYRQSLRSYTITMKSKLQKILPAIRDSGNPEGEEALVQLIIDHENSQFEFDKSISFLIDRKREFNAIKFLVETVKNTTVEVADFEKATDVAFIFGKDKLVLLTLNILSDTTNTQNFLDGNPTNEDGFWYNDPAINGHVGSLLRSMNKFADTNSEKDTNGYMVKLDHFKEEPIVMSALLKGYVRSNEFINPPAPEVSTNLEISPRGFRFKVLKANLFITKLKITSKDALNFVTHESIKEVSVDIVVGGNIDVTLEGLEPAHVYSFHVQYMTELGTGPPGPDSSLPFSTRPTSPPQDLLETANTPRQISVSWQAPAEMAETLNTDDLEYRVTVQGTNGFELEEITREKDFVLMNPALDTGFIFSVRSVLKRELEGIPSIADSTKNYTKVRGPMDVTFESAPTSLTLFSIPSPPKMVQVLSEEVHQDTATVKWEAPAMNNEANLIHYVLEYNAMNENGTENFDGTKKRLVLPTATEVTLDNLTPGSVYSVRVKVTTTMGESEFSAGLLFMTDSDDENLGAVRSHLMAEIQDLTDEAKDHTTYCAWWTPQGSQVFLEDDTCNGGSMNDQGVFNVMRAGLYQVTLSIQMKIAPGTDASLWIRVSGVNMEETKIHATNDFSSFSDKTDSTGRSLVLDLAQGENVSLFTDDPQVDLGKIPFCVSSVKI